MPFVSRASLSQEFLDRTSLMLLKQPEPQYLHSIMWKMALSAALETQSELGLPLPGRNGIGAQGEAPYIQPEELRLDLDDPIMAGALTVVPEFGKAGVGHSIRLNRPIFQDTTYTAASREVPNGSTISTTPINISSEQVTVTMKRFAGPYDQANTRVAPFGVDRFDASMSIHQISSAVGTHLTRDFDKTIDVIVRSAFDNAANVIYPAGFAADSDITATGAAPMDYDVITRGCQKLDELNIPVFGNGKRVMILHPGQKQQLIGDAQFARYAMFNPPVNPLLKATYFKTIDNVDLYQSNTLGSATNGSSVSVKYAQMFGPGAVGVGIGELPHTATSTADNFGEHALVLWLMYGAFATLDNRFILSLRTG